MGRGAEGFEMLQRRIWIDTAFLELSTDARLLFIWSFTAPDNALCGLYPASPRQLERALTDNGGPSDERVRERVRVALRELARKPLVLYDDDAEVLYVCNRAKHANRSPKVRVLLVREFEACPPSPLKDRFLREHGSLLGISKNGGRPR